MRTRLGITVSLAIVAVAGGILMTSTASGQTVAHYVLPLDGIKESLVDVNHDGLRLGDRISARGRLLDEDQTERVGTAYVQCLVHRRIVSPDRGLWNCNYVLALEDGEIVLQGLDPRGPGVYEMAVIGGTGAYAGASGDATFTDSGIEGVDPDPRTDIMLRLGG